MLAAGAARVGECGRGGAADDAGVSPRRRRRAL